MPVYGNNIPLYELTYIGRNKNIVQSLDWVSGISFVINSYTLKTNVNFIGPFGFGPFDRPVVFLDSTALYIAVCITPIEFISLCR